MAVYHLKEVRTGTHVGQELEAGANAEAMEVSCLLACFPWLAQLAFLLNPGPPAQGWHHPHLHHWSLIEKMPYSYISWRHFLKGSSFLCDNSSLCQVDTQNQPGQLLTAEASVFGFCH